MPRPRCSPPRQQIITGAKLISTRSQSAALLPRSASTVLLRSPTSFTAGGAQRPSTTSASGHRAGE